MSPSALLTDCLKRELRAQRISYAALAARLGLSTATVKRMFSRRNFDLARLDAICCATGIDFESLARGLGRAEPLVSQLRWEQEAEIVGDDRLFATAVCALNLMDFEEMLALYRLAPADCVRCLLRLDRMGFLRLLPNNRYRLLVSRTFRWLPDGPILRYFRSQAGDFLGSRFDGPGEVVRVVNVRLTEAARLQLLARIEALVAEYSGQHNAEAAVPSAMRRPLSLLVAARRWEPAFMRRLRRQNAGEGDAQRRTES
ncbi:helix-turn-helix transcriptional regulator [Burkholderiaceae bacterium FT117]|uniref:helix-turn-helix domain-containing protein n=1 Tax=Zeimonas sediminis TaxID=2944268 RepID=UPI002342CF2E|nr:helix-turn-helix transcriptional regulator [Zeimonas sediminis]MCM5568974.1 helix-turn-helix transcriptional regulator [Zeimonas sediminis]